MFKLPPVNKERVEQTSNEVRTPLRYLVLGSTGYGGIDSVDWVEGELPNLVDYDTIIVDVPALTANKLVIKDVKRFEQIRIKLVQFLNSHGTIVVITCPTIINKRPNRYPETITNYIWSPIDIGTNLERGKSIIIKDDRYKKYLKLFTDWDYLFFIPKGCLRDELTNYYGSTNTTRYKIPTNPILENRNRDVLAGSYRIEVRYAQKKGTAYSNYTWDEYPVEPSYVTGEIILLPRIQGMDNRKAISLIIEEITGKSQETLSPQWAEKIIVPGVPGLILQVNDMRRQIKRFEGEITSLNEKIDGFNEYKRLLYSSGKELENIVERCLKDLGGQVLPAKYSQEEFVLIYKGSEYLVEVKGVSKSISLKHLRQLNDYLLKYQEDTGKSCKGILFGNAWCTLPPQKRDKPETPVFPDDVTKRADQWDIALVSSTLFFEAFINFLEHGKGDSLLTAMAEQKGVIQFPVA